MTARRVPVLLVLVVALAACGASARDKALRTSLVTVNTTRDAFVAYDAERQMAIANDPAVTSYEDGIAKLEAYRKRRQVLVSRIEAAYRVIAAAAVLSDDVSIATITGAALLVEQTWRELREGKP